VRPTPPEALKLIKDFEGFRAVGYLCPAGVATAGWGHTGGVEVGKRYSREQCELWLAEDIRKAHAKLCKAIPEATVNALNDNQYSALLSFCFNLGANPKWTIWKKINGNRLNEVPDELMRFVNAGGKRLNGLVRRRSAEAALWSTADEEPEVPPSPTLRLPDMTPPTPRATPKTPLITSIIAAAGAIPAAATQLQKAAEPYSSASPLAAQAVAFVATVAAIAAMILVVLHWLQRMQAKS
jgi:lysozyme